MRILFVAPLAGLEGETGQGRRVLYDHPVGGREPEGPVDLFGLLRQTRPDRGSPSRGGLKDRIFSRSAILAALNRCFLRRVGACVVLGESLRTVFEGMVPAGRIRVVPNFADEEWFAPPDVIRKKFDAPGPLRVLFLSNLIPGKGHLELLEGWREVGWDGGHLHYFTRKTLCGLLDETGFEVLKVTGAGLFGTIRAMYPSLLKGDLCIKARKR